MGAGRSLEAAFSLRGPIPAGTWRLVADGIIIDSVDVTFELLWRHEDGSEDTVLATFMHHFEPLPGSQYVAQPFEETAEMDAVAAVDGDELVFRYTGEGTSVMMAYIPNGDGPLLDGRIPFIDLPQ